MSSLFERLSLSERYYHLPHFNTAAINGTRRESPVSMEGKTCVITGATSGIGRAAAEALAAMGARVVIIARSRQRGEAMLAALSHRFPRAEHSVYYADLLRLDEVRQAAADIAAAEPRIDVLINNAGAMFARRQITPDGFERTLALNYVAPFVLTHGLAECLFASASARVINTSGALHHLAKLHLDDLRLEHRYDAFYAYAHAKLCGVLFTRELARRWACKGVTANCLHPGEVATNFGYQSGGLVPYAFAVIHQFGCAPEKGARRIVRLASARDLADVTGRYFYKMKLSRPNPLAEDDENAARLWATTAKLVTTE